MNSIDHLIPLLNQKKRIAITTHPNPDADALGSSLALYLLLKARGHEVKVITPTDYPDFLRWMKGNEEVFIFSEENSEEAGKIITDADIVFCLDFSMLNRLNGLEEFVKSSKGHKVVIDHHLDPEPFADYQLLNPKAAATAELIYEFILKMEARSEITKEIAECIYAGILTDTGSFKFPSTSSNVHRIIADLIDIGVDIHYVNREIYDTNSLNRLRFIGFALLEKLVVREDLNIAYFVISAEDFDRFGLKKGDTEGLVNYALSIKGIVMATIIIERKEEVKLSFRSVGDYAVNLFANHHFEGGGHKNASGGVSYDGLQPTVQKFESLIDDFQKKYLIKQS